MVELIFREEDPRHGGLEAVLRSVEESGRPAPAVVFVEDEVGSWLRHAARRPVELRRRSVLAAFTDGALVDAVRLEIGGAMWLPASTTSVEEACEAASAAGHRPMVPMATEDLVEMVAGSASELRVVSWRPRGLWRRQLGRRLVDRLATLAERLRCPAVILPWPALLVADRSAAEIESAWRETSDDGGAGPPGPPLVREVSELAGPPEPAPKLLAALAALESEGGRTSQRALEPQPVHELPSGLQVGWWTQETGVEPPGPGWLAAPLEATAVGHIWQLGTGSRSDWETIVDSVGLGGSLPDARPALRLPGWLVAEVGRGTPAGLLVERLARDGLRAGRPLWVPNVDFEGVQFLLSLPGPIWVDGPGVPRPRG